MASPCEVLTEEAEHSTVQRLCDIAYRETKRIEEKFSRYRADSIVSRINGSHGRRFEVDAETANLLDYAAHCHELSEGRFDITSGVLRRVWRFDGGDRLPAQAEIDALLAHIGWDKLSWQRPFLILPEGMEIDLGGIGKEYAVDRCMQLLSQHTDESLLLNFGGDLTVNHPRRSGQPWQVGLDDPDASGQRHRGEIAIDRGGLATSGDARRYLLKDGVRYGHILDPTTGWPVRNAPRSVTVHAANCMMAGMLATFAMLHGEEAEPFLKAQGVEFWIL